MSKQLKVLTYNVNFGNCDEFYGVELTENCRKIIKAIKDGEADIVCLQETNEGWEFLCNKYLTSLYPNQHFAHRINEFMASGSAILTKKQIEIIDVKMKKPNVENTFFYQMICKLRYENKIDLSVVNVHLVPPLSMTSQPCSLDSLFAYCFHSSQLHLLELSELLSYVQTHHFTPSKNPVNNINNKSPNSIPNNKNNNNNNTNTNNNANNNTNIVNTEEKKNNVLIVGDFNEGWAGKSDVWLMENGYIDALKSSNDKTTWYWPLGYGINIWGSYDHIYHKLNPNIFKFIECKTFSEYKHASDHLPVLATFQVNTQE